MSNEATKEFLAWCDRLAQSQRNPQRFVPRVLNINALDDLDPVHYRATLNPEREFDYDGDQGREHSEYLRDNGIGGRQSSVAGTFVQIAAALPVIEAPSIVAEHPLSEPVESEG